LGEGIEGRNAMGFVPWQEEIRYLPFTNAGPRLAKPFRSTIMEVVANHIADYEGVGHHL
jgi:hypothetical protein